MPERDDVYSNPAPPQGMAQGDDDDDAQPLTNDDFRKLMMTPRVPSSSGSSNAPQMSRLNKPMPKEFTSEENDPGQRRREKKKMYARLKKVEEERQKELEKKYRDRAKERRDDGPGKEDEVVSTTADYRAVAPDAKAGENYAERRKQLIQESKYLGGDMEHTHLVKGLDYALLEKVRAEINIKEDEDTFLDEVLTAKPGEHKEKEEEDEEDRIDFKSKLGRSIYRVVFKKNLPERNELFLPHRMAYVVDLDDEYIDSDIPTTMIRSKADCPTLENTTTLSTNDIVINKLTQILSYLRQGRRDRKHKKKEKAAAAARLKEESKQKEKLPGADDNIYGDVDDYVPSYKEKDRRKGDDRYDRGRDDRKYRDRDSDRHRDRDRDRHREKDRERHRDRRDRDRDRHGDKEKKRTYFERPVDEDEERDRQPQASAKDFVQNINEKYKGWGQDEAKERKKEDERNKKLKKKVEVDSYAECYPGMSEMADALDDSDDEADYTKMDMGNKKGPIGRWDFETQEDYSDYMSNKEALPKAAFQYGVKMADGRKTRRAGPKDQKQALDREWQQIQNLIKKRKDMGEGGGSKKIPKY
ncbi:unnamed protein product [Owenia fusiformis]|uniref:Uncharacterized protein n=1 Tax=Owenia fusiformis TaxID=6347 RepID=A0A8J1TFR9_OWEFU|nr:unnamed protein product [Owenia fusiformis]